MSCQKTLFFDMTLPNLCVYLHVFNLVPKPSVAALLTGT